MVFVSIELNNGAESPQEAGQPKAVRFTSPCFSWVSHSLVGQGHKSWTPENTLRALFGAVTGGFITDFHQ
jgi:hypothetical protein